MLVHFDLGKFSYTQSSSAVRANSMRKLIAFCLAKSI